MISATYIVTIKTNYVILMNHKQNGVRKTHAIIENIIIHIIRVILKVV